MNQPICNICLVFVFFAIHTTAVGDLIISNPIVVSNTGVGFGAAPPILTLQNTGSQSGSVLWSGSQDLESNTDPTTGSSAGGLDSGKTETITAAQMLSTGSSNFGIIFNINEAGMPKVVNLDNLSVYLYLSDGTLLAADHIGAGPLEEGGGQGGDGYFFPLTFTGSTYAQFFSDHQNRLGLSASLSNSEAGAESFRVATAVPEPSSFLFLGFLSSCVAGCVIWKSPGRTRSRRHFGLAGSWFSRAVIQLVRPRTEATPFGIAEVDR